MSAPIPSPPAGPEAYGLRTALEREVDDICNLAEQYLGAGVAGRHLVGQLWRHNPEILQAMILRDDTGGESLIGFVAFLPLRPAGVAAIRSGTFSGAAPRLDWVAARGEWPVAIYFWASVALKHGDRIVTLFDTGPVGRRYEGLDRYSSASTEAGLKIHLRHGYVPLRHADTPKVGDIFVRYARAPVAAPPLPAGDAA